MITALLGMAAGAPRPAIAADEITRLLDALDLDRPGLDLGMLADAPRPGAANRRATASGTSSGT